MSVYAVVDGNGLIVNRVMVADTNTWPVPVGCTLRLETDTVYAIGGTFVGAVYTAPPPPQAIAPPPLTTQVEISTLKILFNHENRIRVLEGKATITQAQFLAALITLLGG